MITLKGKYPFKFFIYLALCLVTMIGGLYFDLTNNESVFKVIIVIGTPVLFFCFCIDSAPKVKLIQISYDYIDINAILWHGLKPEKISLKKTDLKAINIGSNGYTIVVDSMLGNIKFDARYLVENDAAESFLKPQEVISIMETGS